MSNIVSIIIVASLGIIGNIIYLEYRFKKEKKTKASIDQLTKLLQPLYIILKTDELEYYAWQKNDNVDFSEYLAGMPDRLLKPIKNILDKYLYLANDELQLGALEFIQWGYSEDEHARYEKIRTGELGDPVLDKFSKLIYKKYDEQRKIYLKLVLLTGKQKN